MSKKYWYLLVILFSIPTYLFFLSHPGYYYNMQDDMQIIRQLEMDKCFQDGQIPCRWTPDLGYEYGYPLFNYYPPLPSLVGQGFKTIGFSYMGTVKALAVTQYFLSSIFIFMLTSSIFGNIGGFLSTILFTFTPYHALNIYVRGAYNEAWANVFFPLILYFTKKLIYKNKPVNIIALAISYSFLLLTHNPMTLIFTPIVAVWAIFWMIQKNSPKNFFNTLKPLIKPFALSAFLSLGLAAFFTLPLLFETKLVQVETMFQNYYNYSAHFVDINQLFIKNFWGDGASVWGEEDGMSFMIGYMQWILPAILLLYTGYLRLVKKKIHSILAFSTLLAFLGFATAFMSHGRSTFIWKILTPLQKIQFPWRFLNITTILLSLSVGGFSIILKQLIKSVKIRNFTYGFLILLTIVLNYQYFYPITYGQVTDQEKFKGDSWRRLTTAGIYDYLPKTASTAAKGPAQDYIDGVTPLDAKYTLSGAKKGTDWIFFNIDIDRNSQITLPLLAFPHFEVKDNQQTTEYAIEPELGRIVLDLSAGQHQIYVKLRNTPIRTIANTISLLSWAYLLNLAFKSLCKKTKSKK